MKTYKPVTTRVVNKRRFGLTIGVLAGVIVAIVLCFYFIPLNETDAESPAEDDTLVAETFTQGVSVGGVDVSGLTIDQARDAVAPVQQQMLTEGEILFTIPDLAATLEKSNTSAGSSSSDDPDGNTGEESTGEDEDAQESAESEDESAAVQHSYAPSQMGVSIDIETPLEQAMAYSREQRQILDDWQLAQETAEVVDEENPPSAPQPEPSDFPLNRVFDQTAVEKEINDLAEMSDWRIDPIGESYKVETYHSESSLTTSGEFVKVPATDGIEVDTQALINEITKQIEEETYTPVEAEVQTIKYNETDGEPLGEIIRMGSYTTNFSGSTDERMYNIWKMSTKLNGAVFYPGEEFSINDTAGERNAENGWAEALGIEDGKYTPQYGGGICQVSSTMYNAVLLAEMKPTARVPHTIAAKYVPKGQDATISTGGPDFKVVNPYDTNMYMIIFCDVPDRTITVNIYGFTKRDYTVQISSELVSEIPKPETEYATNSALGPYEVKEVRPGQKGEVYNIYKQKLDGDGNPIGEKEKISSSTYNAITPKYEVGAGIPLPATGTPIETVRAQAAELAGANAPPVEEQPLDPSVEQPSDASPPSEQPSEQPSEDPPVDSGTPEDPVVEAAT